MEQERTRTSVCCRFLLPFDSTSRPWPCHADRRRRLTSWTARTFKVDRTRQVVEQQIGAMGAVVYEIGLYKPEADREGQPVMIPRIWDVEGLLRSLSWLRLQNSLGRNIYIRPKGEHNLSLVDDLSTGAIHLMKTAGYAPAVIVETSPGNFQAWLKHPRALPKELSTAVAQHLAKEFGGDTGAADWRHFGRLAGFTNRKEKYRQDNGLFPFVRLKEASGAEYTQGEPFIESVKDAVQQAAMRRQTARVLAPGPRAATLLKDIESFRRNPTYAGDGTRIDLAYAIYALSHGLSEVQVGDQIRTRSLGHKGSERRQNEYVERTIKKANELIDRRRPVQSLER
jgi:RepB DNA-primase from phage plasmid